MKERPILFSSPMVLALLAGAKTQTRRIVKPQPVFVPDGRNWVRWNHGKFIGAGKNEQAWAAHAVDRCPYGQPGDSLWVREGLQATEPDGPIQYQADGYIDFDSNWVWQRKKLSAMHCPRGMSRIDLEVTGIRVERLQDISTEDCMAEGIPAKPLGRESAWDVRDAWIDLWESINGEGSWGANPWLWVVEFRRSQPGVDQHG